MLVSFQLASKYPENLAALFDNLETASDLSCFEVLVKADTEDLATRAFLESEVRRRRFRLVPLIAPRRRGYEDLWEALNDLHHIADPSAYFVCNINDEVRIQPAGWDDRLKSYVGLFPDHIFRLRTSKLKFRNYYDFWECGFAPENYAFYTKRWMDICGDWGPCFGPDSSQQYIAYYLGYGNYPSIKQYNRDVPILDISWANEGVGLNIMGEEARLRRAAANLRLWGRQVSHPMQQELYRRARLLQAHIMQASIASAYQIEVVDDRRKRTILLRDVTDHALLDLLPYRISKVRLLLQNLRRYLRYTYFAGGGRQSRNVMPISVYEFLYYRHLIIRHALESISRLNGCCSSGARHAVKSIVEAMKYIWSGPQCVVALFGRWAENCRSGLKRYARSVSLWKERCQSELQIVATSTFRWTNYRYLGLQPVLWSISRQRNLYRNRARSAAFRRRILDRWRIMKPRLEQRPMGRFVILVGRPIARQLFLIDRSIRLMRTRLADHLMIDRSQAGRREEMVSVFSYVFASILGLASYILGRIVRIILYIVATVAKTLTNALVDIVNFASYLLKRINSLIARILRRAFRNLGRAFRIFSRALRILRSLIATVTNPWVWRTWGRRLSLALMDRDWRWFTIKDLHSARLASLHNPWFDPYEEKNKEGEGTEVLAQAAEQPPRLRA